MPENKSTITLFGLSLDLKVNVLALIALALSIGGLVLQAAQIIRGSHIIMSNGERVNFVRQVNPAQPQAPFLVVNARLDYVNKGAVGRDAIVSREYLTIQFGDRVPPYEYRWLHFELFIPDESGRPKPKSIDGGHSFLVQGGGSETHQTTFVPFRDAKVRTPGAKSAAIIWNDFLTLIKMERPIILKFFAKDRLGRSYDTECKVFLTDVMFEALQKNDWTTAICEE